MRLLFFILIFLSVNMKQAQALPLETLHLPPKFQITVLANVPQARQLALGKRAIFAGSRTDKVYAILPGTHGQKTEVITIAKGLNAPNGVAFHNGALYVAETDRILRFDHIESQLRKPSKPVLIRNDLPKDPWHGYRVIKVGPDNKLYIGIGMPCNICAMDDARFGTLMRMNLDGSQFEIYARGLRNTVGFDWDPRTHQLWFTDNGADEMGDDIPPDKFNYAPQSGMNFGFPYIHGKHILDSKYGKLHQPEAFSLPTLALPAHVAALGVRFYTGSLFPTDYKQRVFIAEHGSWNRSKKVGYQVISVKVNQSEATDAKPFITGWLKDEKVWGRPVDMIVMPDGSLLISDDFASVVYRVSYKS